LPQGFKGGSFLFGSGGSCAGGRACTTDSTDASTDTAARNAAYDTGFENTFCTLGQIEVAGCGSDDALACGFAQHFAARTEGRSLSDAASTTADEARSNTVHDSIADLVAHDPLDNGAEGCRFAYANSGASGSGNYACLLWGNAFCDKALIQFIDTAENGAAE
jgi:hypothetical protein